MYAPVNETMYAPATAPSNAGKIRVWQYGDEMDFTFDERMNCCYVWDCAKEDRVLFMLCEEKKKLFPIDIAREISEWI